MQKISNPIPIFLDARGALIDGGQIYIGVANADPQVQPVQAYWDSLLTVPATQPLRTLGGRVVNGVVPSSVFINADDYSMTVLDSDGSQVDYSPSVFNNDSNFQPLDPTLTAVAANGATPYGLTLLDTASAAALKTSLGVPANGAAASGVNADITSLTSLTQPYAVASTNIASALGGGTITCNGSRQSPIPDTAFNIPVACTVEINLSMSASYSSGAKSLQLWLRVDGVDTWSHVGTGTDNYPNMLRFTFLSAGSHTFGFAVTGADSTVSLQDISLLIRPLAQIGIAS